MATDVASKGLDFPDIQHVVNFDMPDEIENYVHRIGRTGRCGKTGIATTFINKNQSESILLDLKHLLQEAKQRIPPVLQACPSTARRKMPAALSNAFDHVSIATPCCPRLFADAQGRVASQPSKVLDAQTLKCSCAHFGGPTHT